jgi:hypothetical protein
MHPLLGNLLEFTDNEIEKRIAKLSSAYFMTQDEGVRHQMILLLDDYKLELENRRFAQRKKQQDHRKDGGNDLDSLINIS